MKEKALKSSMELHFSFVSTKACNILFRSTQQTSSL